MNSIYNKLIEQVISSETWKKYNSTEKNIAKKIQNIGYLGRLIKMYVLGYYEYYGGFGPHNNSKDFDNLILNMLQFILNYLDKQVKINCMKKITRSTLFNNWINHVLYKPGGIRDKTILKDYERLVLKN